MRDSVVGVWSLREFYMEDVETKARSEPFGSKPCGTLILHPDGRMAALVTPRARSAPGTEADQAAAFQKLIAYSGRYRLEPPDRFVTSVDIAWFQPWVGTDQVRAYTLDGDRLEIVSAPGRLPQEGSEGAMAIGILSWERETAATAEEGR